MYIDIFIYLHKRINPSADWSDEEDHGHLARQRLHEASATRNYVDHLSLELPNQSYYLPSYWSNQCRCDIGW